MLDRLFEYYGLIVGLLVLLGWFIRWMFPKVARILGWAVLATSLPLAGFLLFWGFIELRKGDYAALGGLISIFFGFSVGGAGVMIGSALVWGKDA